jgi:hypothetical protein
MAVEESEFARIRNKTLTTEKKTQNINSGYGDTYVSGNLLITGSNSNLILTSSTGIKLNAYDGPLITRNWNPIDSGDKQGVGTWGLFMEPAALNTGIPSFDYVGAGEYNVACYNQDGTIESTPLKVTNQGLVTTEFLQVAYTVRSSLLPDGDHTRDLGMNDPFDSTIRWRNIYGKYFVVSDGGGIDFSNFSNATGKTSEVLDDYEEGKWTPGFWGSTVSGSVTYTDTGYALGSYTKIGRTVTCHGSIRIWSWGTKPTGNLRIGGFPFTSRAATEVIFYTGLVGYYGFIGPAGRGPYTLLMAENATSVDILYDFGSNVPASELSSTLNDESRLAFTITYEV